MDYFRNLRNREGIQKYIQTSVDYDNWNTDLCTTFPELVEITVTFNPCFYTLQTANDAVLATVTGIIRCIAVCRIPFVIDTAVEYHKNGMPHIHIGIYSITPLQNVKHNLWQQVSGYINKRGKSSIYHTPRPFMHHIHEMDKVKEQTYLTHDMNWYQYVRKDKGPHNEKNYLLMICFFENWEYDALFNNI